MTEGSETLSNVSTILGADGKPFPYERAQPPLRIEFFAYETIGFSILNYLPIDPPEVKEDEDLQHREVLRRSETTPGSCGNGSDPAGSPEAL